MNKTGEYILVAGTSGSGKSTRTEAVVKWLLENDSCQSIQTEAGTHIGYRFEGHNCTIMGKMVDWQGEKRWKGADNGVGVFGNAKSFWDWSMNHVLEGNRLLLEGSSILNSARWLPTWVAGAGVKRGGWLMFTYSDYTAYETRLFQRTGKMPSPGREGWAHNERYIRMIDTIRTEIAGAQAKPHSAFTGRSYALGYQDPLDAVGVFLGLSNHFRDWCKLSENDIPSQRRKFGTTKGLLED